MVGLDVAGIDFICPDIAAPVRETGGAIVEVNAHRGSGCTPTRRSAVPQFIAKPVVDLLFPPGAPSRCADRRRHRHQRQDDDVAHDRPHLQGAGPQGRDDVDRRGRHRRAPRHQGRRVRSDRLAWSSEPACRLRCDGGRPRRHPPRRPRVRPQRRRRRHQRRAGPPGAGRDRHASAAGPGQGGHRRGGAAGRVRGAQLRRPVGPPDAPALQRRRHLVLARVPRHRQPRVHRAALPPRRAGRGPRR